MKLTDVAKTYATFSVFASKVSWVYYATGLRGTTPPTFEAAKFQHPPLYSVNLI